MKGSINRDTFYYGKPNYSPAGSPAGLLWVGKMILVSEVIFKGVFCKLDTLFRSVRKNILVLGAVYRFTIFVSSWKTEQFLNICFVIMLKLLSNYLSSGNCPRKYTRLTDPKLIWSPPTCYSTLLHSSQSFHCIKQKVMPLVRMSNMLWWLEYDLGFVGPLLGSN